MVGQSMESASGNKGLKLPLSRCVALDTFSLENFISKMGITAPNSELLVTGIRIK